MSVSEEVLNYVNSIMQPWMQAQNQYRQNQVQQWLMNATGGNPTSVAAAANSQIKPVGNTIDSSWIFKDPVGSGKQANALGMQKVQIDNANNALAQINEQNRQNWFQMLLAQMPQFQLPMPDLGGFGQQQQMPRDTRPMTGSIQGLEGINDWSKNATTDNGKWFNSTQDMLTGTNSNDVRYGHEWNARMGQPAISGAIDRQQNRMNQVNANLPRLGGQTSSLAIEPTGQLSHLQGKGRSASPSTGNVLANVLNALPGKKKKVSTPGAIRKKGRNSWTNI